MRRLLLAFLLLFAALQAHADAGVLIPKDKQTPDPAVLSLVEMQVRIVIDNGDAHISITQIFANHTGHIEEGTYRFSLPSGSTVSDFAVWDGPVRIPAVILERKRAEQVYEQARAQAIDPGLLQMGERDDSDPHSTAVFTAQIVPIPAYGTKRLELDYHQRIVASEFKQFFALPLRPDANQHQSARHFKLLFELHSAHDVVDFQAASKLYPLTLTTSDKNTVIATFEGTNLSLDEDFQATWSLAQQSANQPVDQLEIITHRDPKSPLPSAGEAAPAKPAAPEPGFFQAQMLIADPKPAQSSPAAPPRTFLLLFDNSLSMQWEKLERSYAALEALLHSLTPADRFNVLLFNQDVTSFQPAPVAAAPDAVKQALDFVRGSKLRGGTDLLKVLNAALAQSTAPNTSLILLTDGGSDRGETVLPRKIAAQYATRWKQSPHPPHTDIFAVGDDANLPLLRQLARNDGILEQVLSTEPYEFKLKSFLSKLTHAPVSGLTLTPSDASVVSLVYPLDDAVYPGSFAQWIGQYKPSTKPLTLTVKGTRDNTTLEAKAQTTLPASDPLHPQLPRIWAQARVNALLEQIDREGETAAAIEEIIRLSRRYKFVTPYTSFLAVPRSLLRPRVIRPGDPVLRVRTDPAITSVIALFPFGLTKPLRHLADEDKQAPVIGKDDEANRLWETRFLAPPEMKDGTYSVRLILRDIHGNTYREAKTFVIASTPPTVHLQLSRTRLHRGETLELRALASASTRTLTARLEGAAPVSLRWSPSAQTNTGVLIIPSSLPIGRYTLTVTAEDVAHNLGTQEVQVDVIPKPLGVARLGLIPVAVLGLAASAIPVARADLPSFLQHVVGASSFESALFRVMHLPQTDALYPRPPKEATQQLASLIEKAPADASLYALRARSEEQSLDFAAAESDWKTYATHASDPIAGQLELADFYHRRLDAPHEIATLTQAAAAPSTPAERFVNPAQQRSWRAFERTLALEADQALSPNATYEAFLRRYSAQPAVFTRFFRTLLDERDYAAAEALIPRYRQAFPADAIFPITAQALLEYGRGDTAKALAIYDRAFDPLWPLPLIQSYYGLLAQTHQQRLFLAAAQDRLAQHPDDLNALARVFFYYQQQSHSAEALQALDRYRLSKESRSAAWSPLELYTLATLATQAQAWPEAARYNYALAATSGALPTGEPAAQPAAQAGLAGLIHILLTAPDQPIALGAGNLTMYRDIAALDQGPGYWNGILSLWLNGQSPSSEYRAESDKAQPYFHRAKAAELLAQLDRAFPNAPQRPALHAELLHAAAEYGDPAPVLDQGKRFLAGFPASPDRVDIANLMADAYARQKNTAAEFALYDSLLAELAAKSEGQPLTAAAGANPLPAPADEPRPQAFGVGIFQSGAQTGVYAVNSPQPGVFTAQELQPAGQRGATPTAPAFELQDQPPIRPDTAAIQASTQYAQLLDRYLARLTAAKQLPQALAVLRAQLDRSPDDPRLYERLAQFLDQNNLSADEEQTYKLALDRFQGHNGQDPTWYDRLASLYLRQKRRQDFATLTRQVTDIFSGTELDRWFAQVRPDAAALGPQLALQLNLYAAKRFPHDLVFTRNLLTAYTTKPTVNAAAWDALIRRHWWESPDLRDRFFESLARTGRLDAELAQLQPATTSQPDASANPASTRELAEAQIWSSHFEQSAPLLGALADLYPADPDLGDRAVSLFRSLAYLDPTPASTARAVALETHLLAAAPDNPDRLATLGDLYAEATSTGGEDLASAAPYWRRIPTLHPGSPAGYLTSATVFWDYFQFDDALAEITRARTAYHLPALFGYEAGAIEESRHDLPAAIREYTAVVTSPVDPAVLPPSVAAFVRAFVEPPSDAADSNFQATGQSLLGSAEAQHRLIQLARRPASAALVDAASTQAVAAAPTATALSLRADVLAAQHHESQLAPTLEAALTRVQTPAAAASLGTLARTHSLTAVYEYALIRQAALTTDPVEKIELEFALARSAEDRNDIPAATRVMDAAYHANPRLLGVVRTTVDFDTRTHQPARAIATLLEAAKAATPDLADAFTLEAAQKANDSGDTAQARALALTLLQKSPYDPRSLAAAAESYAHANDNAGLKQFYLGLLETVRTALPPDERKADTALLRRGLIPALTRLNDYDGATAQYIALLSAYPEDAATAQQAALYALQHSRQPQLLDFLRTTVQSSPRDSRFAILLAQTESTFGDLPAALAAYSQAIAIRKDRVDLYTAHADLALRLDQPELAAADYDRLYLLTYKDPSWMLRLAELRARQQRPADAVKALETAYITGRPANPRNHFTVAQHLADWNLLPQARTFAEQGIALAGKDLLINSTVTVTAAAEDKSDDSSDSPANSTPASPPVLSVTATPSGASTYARILARSGEPGQALTTLLAARQAAFSPTPSLLAAMVHGLSPRDAAAATADYTQRRQQALDQSFTAALTALGAAVQTYATPEQKLPFAQLILQHQTDPKPQPWIAVAHASGLAEVEAALLKQALLAPGKTGEYLTPDTTLQQSRLRFAELAQTLELYARKLKPEERPAILQQAAQAYNSAGDEPSELRLARQLLATSASDHFLDLLLRHDPAALATFASSSNATLADAAATFALAHASEAQTLAVLLARATAPDIAADKSVSTLWAPAATALAGLSFASTPQAPAQARLIDAGFRQILAPDASIAARLAAPANPGNQLTGERWFPYASSYALFRQATPSLGQDAEDLLAANLEATPTSPAPYLELARTYAEANQPPAALVEYAHALELAPGSPSILDEQAAYLLRLNQRELALAAWRAALVTLQSDAEKNAFPASFWADFASITTHLAAAHLAPQVRDQFRPDLLAVLTPYLAHNGTYRSNELLKSAYESSATPAEGIALLLASVAAVPDESSILSDLQSAAWLPPDARATLLQRRIDLARATSADSVTYLQLQLVRLDLDRNALPAAQSVLDAIPPQPKPDPSAYSYTQPTSLAALRAELAARTNHLAPLLAAWTAQPDTAPTPADLQSALTSLQRPTPAYKPIPAQILPLQEFAFEQKRLASTLLPTDYLALASLRLQTADLTGALDLLHRLALQPTVATPVYSAAVYSPDDLASEDFTPDPYTNTDSAARLLESTHHPAEAIPFLLTLTRNEPWNAAYRLRLAQAQLASPTEKSQAPTTLLAVAKDPSAPYATRLQAAQLLAPLHPAAPSLGSAELNLLASANTAPEAARQPYFAAARAVTAQPPLLAESLAIDPTGPLNATARLALLRALLAQGPPAAALATFTSFLNTPQAPTAESTAETSEDSATADEPATPAVYLPAPIAALDAPARAHLAVQIAAAYEYESQEHEGALATAIPYLQLAATLDPADPAPARHAAELRATLALAALNAARRPTVHKALEQSPADAEPRTVRSRLLTLPALQEATQ